MDCNKNKELILQCIAIYIGNYPAERQYAASILLKTLLKTKKYRKLMATIKEELGFKINDRNDSAVISWKKKVKKKGCCEVCGSKENLTAHHIIPWECSITGRTDTANGMCLCESCHKMMHNDAQYIDYMRDNHGKK